MSNSQLGEAVLVEQTTGKRRAERREPPGQGVGSTTRWLTPLGSPQLRGNTQSDSRWGSLPLVIFTLLLMVGTSPAADSTPPIFELLDTSATRAKVVGKDWLIIDARDSNSFNGWALHGEKRGGHIPGAVNIALPWVEKDLKGTQKVLTAKGIFGTKPILLYGTSTEEAVRMASLLVKKHQVTATRLHIFKNGFPAWSAEEVPVEKLPRFDRLLPASVLAAEMKSRPELRVFEVSWGKGEKYEESHIPGAFHLNTDLLETPPIWDLVPPAKLAEALASIGIMHDTPVVLYGENPMPAAFGAAVMMYTGVKDVRVLHGGFPAWKDAGLPTEKGMAPLKPVKSFGSTAPARPEIFTGIENARKLRSEPNHLLVDVRSWKEYIGEVTGYDDIKAKGRIRGAVWGHGGTDAMKMEDFRNPDGTLRDYQDIAKFWAEAGITPEKSVGFYCGTGWRASETYLAAWVMGWEKITVYDGGWYEWSAKKDNPVDQGDPTQPKPPTEEPKKVEAEPKKKIIPGIPEFLPPLWQPPKEKSHLYLYFLIGGGVLLIFLMGWSVRTHARRKTT